MRGGQRIKFRGLDVGDRPEEGNVEVKLVVAGPSSISASLDGMRSFLECSQTFNHQLDDIVEVSILC